MCLYFIYLSVSVNNTKYLWYLTLSVGIYMYVLVFKVSSYQHVSACISMYLHAIATDYDHVRRAACIPSAGLTIPNTR